MATAKGSDILRDFLQNGIDPTKDELVEDNAESLQESRMREICMSGLTRGRDSRKGTLSTLLAKSLSWRPCRAVVLTKADGGLIMDYHAEHLDDDSLMVHFNQGDKSQKARPERTK